MKFLLTEKIEKSSALVFAFFENGKISNSAFFKLISKEDRNYLLSFVKENKPKGEFSKFLFLPSNKPALIFSLGERSKFNFRRFIRHLRQIVQLAKGEKIKNLEISLSDFADAETIAIQMEMANFEFVRYKTKPKDGWHFVEEVLIYADGAPRLRSGQARINADKIKAALRRGKIIGEEINEARALSNTPGGEMTPAKLAEAARKAGGRAGFKVKVLEEPEMKKLGMGGVLGVSRGSAEKPRFIVMEYFNGPRSEKPVVLVGKGVTFDTGGLNLKPSEAMYEMHMDMSGGAAVIHILAILARLGIKKNVVGIVPAVENMPSGSGYHPGDLLKTMSGKTIEVLNTDAEGRIILADGLTYAQKFYKPRLVVDVATLTGAAMVALGQRASAIFSTDEKLEKDLREIGEKTGDYVWPMPLWEEYEADIKGTFGDVANTGKTRYGGAITGAVFLWQFIKDCPWVHIDIASRMTSAEGDFLAKGAAGAAINLLTHFLESF